MIDVEQTIISQYSTSPTIVQLVQNMNEYLDPSADFDNFFSFVWDVSTAQGFGLNCWGKIVNVSRQLTIPGGATYLGFSEAYTAPTATTGPQPWGQAPFYAGTQDTETFTLSDDAYRTLILVKALANISNCTAPSLNQLLQNLFAGRGRCYVADLGNMQISFTFEFYLQPFELAIMTQSGAIPRPAAVGASLLQAPSDSTFGFREQTIGFVTPLGTPLIYRNDWQGNQLLYAAPRTNQFLQSTNLASGSWSRSNLASVVATTGPDGSSNAYALTSNASGFGFIAQSLPLVLGTPITVSIFARAGSANTFRVVSSTQAGQATFTLTGSGAATGLSGIITAATITALSGGWYACSVTLTPTASGTNTIVSADIIAANSSVTLFGPQYGSAGSYIPTTTSPVTVTDYALSGNNIALSSPLAIGASLAWTGSYLDQATNTPVFVTQQPTGNGDGASRIFPFAGQMSQIGAQPFGQGTFFTGTINAS